MENLSFLLDSLKSVEVCHFLLWHPQWCAQELALWAKCARPVPACRFYHKATRSSTLSNVLMGNKGEGGGSKQFGIRNGGVKNFRAR